MDKKDILIGVSLFFVAFLIRVVGVSNVCIYLDEFVFWVITNRILANNFAPTLDVFHCSSPFIPYIEAVFTVLFGGGLYQFRMVSVIFGSLTVPFLYLFGKAMYDRRTGLLSALFLCFSAYHCLYSRIFRYEAFALFFITAFLYFFWRSQRSDNRRSMYASIAGAMLGIAISAKYLPFFLIPALILYVLWTKRFRFKALLDKRIILTLIFTLLFFSPMLICFFITGANPAYTYAIEIPERRASIQPLGYSYPLGALVINGMEKINKILTWDAEFLIPPWTALFKLSAILLFIITILSYLPSFINREKEGSFLLIAVFTLCIFILSFITVRYYLMYSFPFYFVMLSHLAVKSFDHLRIKMRREKPYKTIFRIFTISLIAIMLFSYVITGVTSPYYDEGERSWSKSAIDYIKRDIIKSGYEGDILIGRIGLKNVIGYNMHLCDLDASTISIVMPPGSEYTEEGVKIDLEKIDRLKLNYLIVSEDQYDTLFKKDVKKEIFKDYEMVFRTNTYYSFDGLVLKRKNMQPSEPLLLDNGGEISKDIFNRSVPGVVEVGKVYTALVQVKNTGESRTTFAVHAYSENFIIFIEGLHELTLDRGSSRMLKFKMVPNREHVGEIPIMVDLYAKYGEDEMYEKKVDSVTDYVYLIKK